MEDAKRRYVHERPDPTTGAPQPREGTTRNGGSKPAPTTPRPDTTPQGIRSNGTVHLPRGWRALNIEETESGTIVWVERRGIGSWLADAAERGFRRLVWPYIGGKK